MPKNKQKTYIENLTVQSVAAEGKCVAHTPEGQVVFMEYAVPGDVVDVLVTKKKKNYIEGRISRIVSPSEHRLEPFCEHFGVCGGCIWQQLPYEMQLEAKRQQVEDQLVRIGHLEIPEVSPVLGSAQTRRYRNKLEFTASDKRWFEQGEIAGNEQVSYEERVGLGFHVGKFFDKVLDIRDCSLQREPSNAVRLFIKSYALSHGISFYNIRERHGLLRNVIVRTAGEDQLMVIVCFAQDFEGLRPMMQALQDSFPEINSLYYIINPKPNDSISDLEPVLFSGNDAIYETMEGLRFKISPKSFYQTNSRQAWELYRKAREFAGLDGSQTVYDLYTGTGTIAQFVSSKAAKVIGIEYVQQAIDDANANAKANGIDNCEFFAGDMKDILTPAFIQTHGRPDVVITDPPRAGMHPDVIKTIMQAAPETIVYVSCNPASQARDLQELSKMYTICAVQPVDMFPHTKHVENICKLKLKA